MRINATWRRVRQASQMQRTNGKLTREQIQDGLVNRELNAGQQRWSILRHVTPPTLSTRRPHPQPHKQNLAANPKPRRRLETLPSYINPINKDSQFRSRTNQTKPNPSLTSDSLSAGGQRSMGNPEKLMAKIFDLKYTSKSLQRQGRKCEKEEKEQKLKVKKAIEKGNVDGARIYAENAIRKRTEHMNYLRLLAELKARG